MVANAFLDYVYVHLVAFIKQLDRVPHFDLQVILLNLVLNFDLLHALVGNVYVFSGSLNCHLNFFFDDDTLRGCLQSLQFVNGHFAVGDLMQTNVFAKLTEFQPLC